METIAGLTYRLRFLSWALVLGSGIALWLLNPPPAFEQSVEAFFQKDDPALVAYRKAAALFGEDNFVFVAYDDAKLWSADGMGRVAQLADAIRKEVPGVERIESLDAMPIPWLADKAVQTLVRAPWDVGAMLRGRTTVSAETSKLEREPVKLDDFRRRICSHPLFNNLLIDQAGTSPVLFVRLVPGESRYTETIVQLRRTADAFGARHGLGRVAVVGPAVLVVDGFLSLDKDNRTLALVAMALMAATMLIAVRSPLWALLPLAAGWYTWLVLEAFLAVLDLRLTLSTGPIVGQTVVLCMPAASHLAIRYRSFLAGGLGPPDAARQTLALTFAPVAWCAVAAAAGYLAAWITSSVRPVMQMGLTMFICNLVAGLLTYLLSAGVMACHRRPPRAAPVARGIGRLTSWVIDHPGPTLLLFALPCLPLAAGVANLEMESNYIRAFRAETRVVSDYRFVEERMGGIGLVELVFPAPAEVTGPWLRQLKETTERMLAIDAEVFRGVISAADILLPDPSLPPKDAREEAKLLQTKLGLLGLPAQAHILGNVWNREKKQMRLLLRVREGGDAKAREQRFAELLTMGRASLGEETYLTGPSHLMSRITQSLVATASESVAWACGMMLLMLLLALYHPLLALLALMPTLLAVGSVLGIMGWLGLRIDMATALVASVAIGLSVDDSFHCLLRWRRERRGRSPREALRTAYSGSGPGVVLSSAAVGIGFTAQLFSDFLPTANFGWLIAVASLGGSVGNLVFVPACLALFVGDRTATTGLVPVER